MREDLDKILKKLDIDDIREFLLDALVNYKEIYDDFRRGHLDLFPMMSVREYRTKIDRDIENCFNSRGYIGEEESYDYSYVMSNYILEAKNLMKNKNYSLALDILMLTLDTIPEYEPDDSFGNINDTASEAIEVIENIFDECYKNNNEAVLENLFKYVLKEISTGRLSNYAVDFYLVSKKFLDNELYVKELQEALLKMGK